MGTKSPNPIPLVDGVVPRRAVTGYVLPPTDQDLEPVGAWDLAPHRPRWRKGQQMRELGVTVSSDRPTATVDLEHRKYPGLLFQLEIDTEGELVGVRIRPLVFRVRRLPGGEVLYNGSVLDLEAVPPGAPRVTAKLLDSAPIGALHAAAVSSLSLAAMVGASVPERRRRSRRSAISDEDLAAFARDYAKLVADGDDAPLRAVAERWHLSYDGAQYRKRRAEDRGLLTRPPGQGRTGGRLTPAAVRLLDAAT